MRSHGHTSRWPAPQTIEMAKLAGPTASSELSPFCVLCSRTARSGLSGLFVSRPTCASEHSPRGEDCSTRRHIRSERRTARTMLAAVLIRLKYQSRFDPQPSRDLIPLPPPKSLKRPVGGSRLEAIEALRCHDREQAGGSVSLYCPSRVLAATAPQHTARPSLDCLRS